MNDVLFDSATKRFLWPEIGSESVRALATHWSTLARDGVAPARARFTPLDLPARVWKNLLLLELCPQSREFVVRVQGTYLVEAAGADLTGKRVNETEIPGSTRRALYGLLQRIAETGTPQYYKGDTLFRVPDWTRHVEQVMCPLTDTDGHVAAVIGAVEFAPVPSPRKLIDADV